MTKTLVIITIKEQRWEDKVKQKTESKEKH